MKFIPKLFLDPNRFALKHGFFSYLLKFCQPSIFPQLSAGALLYYVCMVCVFYVRKS